MQLEIHVITVIVMFQLWIGLFMFLALGVVNGFAQQPLVIYSYDSFMASGGLGPEIIPLFEKKCQCQVQVLPCGDGSQVLTRLQLDRERQKVVAHLALGVDQLLWDRARDFAEPWGAWNPQGYEKISSDLQVERGFLPWDYGLGAWIVDLKNDAFKESIELPKRLADLLKPQWKRKLLLEDPRTSSPGLLFLLWTEVVLRDRVWDFWRSFRSQWLTLTPGWDAAYGLFLRRQVPLIWSYTTSQAYHLEKAQMEYQSLLFEEGQPLQLEGAFLNKDAFSGHAHKMSGMKIRALDFLNFLLSEEVQIRIAQKNWMYPVLLSPQKLPLSFQKLPAVSKKVLIRKTAKEIKSLLEQWSKEVGGF